MTSIRANYDDWRQLSEMHAWEVAMLMRGFDPRARGDVITAEGNPIDISHEVRALAAAVRNGVLEGTHDADLGDELAVVLTASLLPWLRNHGFSELEQALTTHPTEISSSPANASAEPGISIPRQRLQEQIILETIHTLGFDPHNLPPRPGGNKVWVKGKVWEVLKKSKSPYFVSENVFEKAWERLRSESAITEKAPNPSA